MNNFLRTILAGIIALLVATAFFIILEKTPNCIIGYIATLIAITELTVSIAILARRNSRLPQDIAFSMAAYFYAFVSCLFTLLIVCLEVFGLWIMTSGWFIAIHALMIGVFAGMVVALASGKEHIETLDEKVAEKVFEWRSILVDLQAIFEKSDTKSRPHIGKVCDAVRYSDSMSNERIIGITDEIKKGVAQLAQLVADRKLEEIENLCIELLQKIKDCNNRMKSFK